MRYLVYTVDSAIRKQIKYQFARVILGISTIQIIILGLRYNSLYKMCRRTIPHQQCSFEYPSLKFLTLHMLSLVKQWQNGHCMQQLYFPRTVNVNVDCLKLHFFKPSHRCSID
jgi:hypothetical protein